MVGNFDGIDSRVFAEDDWLNAFPEKDPVGADEPTDGALKDEPPDGKAGGPKMADAMDEQAIEDRKQNRSLREKYADKAYNLAQVCLFAWACMLSASGLVNGLRGDPLWSDKVIIAVTTGVTVSVLAVFLGVIRGLFPSGNGEKK